MAFENDVATGVQDLMDRLSTFAQANGWTEDEASAGRLALSKSTVFVSFRWDTSTPANVGVYQALAWVAATDPGNHTDDSGQGIISGTNATIGTGRRVDLIDSPMQYWFFEGDTYIHVVAEVAAGTAYRHGPGFGILEKLGTWTGGEYSYGQRHSNDGGTGTLAIRADSTSLLDGFSNTGEIEPHVGTVHIEGAPEQTAGTKWALVWAGGAPSGGDRASNARMWAVGGFRSGPTTAPLGRFSGTLLQGLLPMTPLNIFYQHPSPSVIVSPLGSMPAVRMTNVKNFVGGQEIAVGADTWIVFPTREKGVGATTGNGTRNQGIAYLKNTA